MWARTYRKHLLHRKTTQCQRLSTPLCCRKITFGRWTLGKISAENVKGSGSTAWRPKGQRVFWYGICQRISLGLTQIRAWMDGITDHIGYSISLSGGQPLIWGLNYVLSINEPQFSSKVLLLLNIAFLWFHWFISNTWITILEMPECPEWLQIQIGLGERMYQALVVERGKLIE